MIAHIAYLPHLHTEQTITLVAILAIATAYCWLTRKGAR